VRERRLLGLDQGLVLLEGMGLKEERRQADGEGLFEGVRVAYQMLVSQLEVAFEEPVRRKVSDVY
jgi:hypothetical protein